MAFRYLLDLATQKRLTFPPEALLAVAVLGERDTRSCLSSPSRSPSRPDRCRAGPSEGCQAVGLGPEDVLRAGAIGSEAGSTLEKLRLGNGCSAGNGGDPAKAAVQP